MGWFKKKKEKKKEEEIPSLPELPKLPELPQSKIKNKEPVHQLPSFPVDSLGEKFSQNTIKEAISGKKEDESAFDKKEESQMFQRHPQKIIGGLSSPASKKIPPERKIPREFKEAARKVKEAEPIFIRIDKFEDGLKIFEKIKKQISEIESMLKEIKETKEKEESELEMWENEIKTAKDEIEKVDNNLFSKIE